MLDRISVATDNIYKFIALFSLVTLIFCGWQLISINSVTNAVIFQNYPEIEALKSLEERSREQEARLAILNRQMEVATEDRNTFNIIIILIILTALLGLYYGFYTWHKDIQPMADAQSKAQLEILHLQMEKLRLEIQHLEVSLKSDEHRLQKKTHAKPTSSLVDIFKALISK